MSYRVSAIVPAYNEEKKIRMVLQSLSLSAYLDEVICIDDGSTDKTASIANSIPGVRVIRLEKNKGKAYAISIGIQEAAGDVVLFVDADLDGLNDYVIYKLLLPLFESRCDGTLGYRTRAGKLEKYFFRPLGGERAYFKKDLLPYLKKFENKGYGLEVFLNNLYKKRRVLPVEIGVNNTWKHHKQSYSTATKLTCKAIAQVTREIVFQKTSYLGKKSIIYFTILSLFIGSFLLTSYSFAKTAEVNKLLTAEKILPYHRYQSLILANVVKPIQDSPYFKDIVVFPLRQIQSSTSGIISYF